MDIRELDVSDVYEVTPTQHRDTRGVFLEWYRFDRLAEVVGHPLRLEQANTSVSAQGVVRGVHFADIPPGQAKYVTVSHGAVLDIVVDIRVGSPTFGRWDSVLLDDIERKALYISEGIGHCFVSLSEQATVSYLVSSTFNGEREHGITPLDPRLGIDFGIPAEELLLSEKDLAAPTLDEAERLGLLPNWNDARAYYAALKEGTA